MYSSDMELPCRLVHDRVASENATTYNLDDYYADPKSVPRLSDEERLRLLRQAGSAGTATGAGPAAPSMLPQQGEGNCYRFFSGGGSMEEQETPTEGKEQASHADYSRLQNRT